MATSESARSLDTHELMPGDIYPHPAEGALIPCHNEVCSLFSDHIMYFCSALVISSLFSSQVSFPKK
jgi:hypothetical protein